MVMAFGGFLGLLGVPLPGVEIGIALSALLLGTVASRGARRPIVAAASLVGVIRDLSRPCPRNRPARVKADSIQPGFVVATGVSTPWGL